MANNIEKALLLTSHCGIMSRVCQDLYEGREVFLRACARTTYGGSADRREELYGLSSFTLFACRDGRSRPRIDIESNP